MDDALTPSEKLSRIQEYQRALTAFARVASEELTPEQLMQHAAAQISGVTHITHTKVLRYRPDSSDLLIVAGVGWSAGVVGHATLHVDYLSPAGRSVQTGAPTVVKDLPNDPDFRYPGVLREHRIVALMNVPVMIDTRTWGVLEVDSQSPFHFDDSDVLFLSAFANVLALGLKACENEAKAVTALIQHRQAEARWETLSREQHHRVRNNFQTIISFLSLQRSRSSTEESQYRFRNSINRVHAIALAYDQLSLQSNASDVRFADYLRALCANIDPHEELVSIRVEATSTSLPLDRAVPAGLIVNELVANAFKYAFEKNSAGTIRVVFAVAPERGECTLAVEDNGKGMGPPREGGLGLSLIEALARQLSGRVERPTVKQGTKIQVSFPLPR